MPVIELPLSTTEIPSSGQQGVKRYFKEEDNDDDDVQGNEIAISRSTAKRSRVWKDGKASIFGWEPLSPAITAPTVIELSP